MNLQVALLLAVTLIHSSHGECSDGSCAGENVTLALEDTTLFLNASIGPGPLDSGKTFCIADGSSEYDFLATYTTGLSNSEQKLCDNDVTRAIIGRGGPGCTSDEWYVVDECNDHCYEFVWRASYPTYCDVEDKWLWCCIPKIKVEPASMCGEYDVKDVSCVVTGHHVTIETLRIQWFDSDGNDLSDFEGFEVSSTYKINDDQLLSVLTVHSSALVEYSEDVTCHVYSTLHSDVSWEETAEVTKFEVTANGETISVGKDGQATCTAVGVTAAGAETHYFTWYYFNEAGERVMADPEETVVQLSVDADGNLVSTITVSTVHLYTGEQKCQCVLSHTTVDNCGAEHTTTCSAEASLFVWRNTPDIYCGYLLEDATLQTTIIGIPELPLSAVAVISRTTDRIITESTDPETDYYITGTYNEDDELVVTLHVDASVNDKVRTEDFYVTVYDELPEEPADMTLHVMDITSGLIEETSPYEPIEFDGLVAKVIVEGGFIESPVWVDDKGRVYRLGTTIGVTVTLEDSTDPEKSVSMLMIPEEFVRELGISQVFCSFRVRTPSGTNCRRERQYIYVGIEDECYIEWDGTVCDDDRCSDYVKERTWSCICPDGNNDKARCTAPPEDVSLSYTCPATLSYEISEWSDEVCDRDECYPFSKTKTRFCACYEDDLIFSDETGGRCGQPILTQQYSCGATKPWVHGDWHLGDCPEHTCFESQTWDVRDCTCENFSDKSMCDEVNRIRNCPATSNYEWSEWGDEFCDYGERCYPSAETKSRTCLCENFGVLYRDDEKCEGEHEIAYICPANLPWTKIPDGNPCYDSGVESCSTYEAMQHYKCMCQNLNDYEISENTILCEGDPTVTTCPANAEYEWAEWNTVSECSYCYPELDQSQVRSCRCGDKEDETRCVGPDSKSESCPATKEIRWFPTEWNNYPCGNLLCNEETFTSRERTCECDGNEDATRCGGDSMYDSISCGTKEYELSEWSSPTCDAHLCYAYTKTSSRTCTCTDYTGESSDSSQCDASPDGYQQEIECSGDIYEWGEWQSRGCSDSCIPSKTKRYRVCACHGDVDFNECEGNAIDFPTCEVPDFCNS